MALILCPECKKEVSEKALACPQCGFPIEKYIAAQNLLEKEKNEQEKTEQTKLEQDRIGHESPGKDCKNLSTRCNFCGDAVNPDDDYCDKCGMRLTDYVYSTDTQPIESSHLVENGNKKTGFLNVFLWIFFLPIMAIIFIIKSPKLKNTTKIVFVSLILIVFAIVVMPQDEEDNVRIKESAAAEAEAEIQPKEVIEEVTEESADTVSESALENSEYNEKLENEICQDLIGRGVEENIAIKMLDIVKLIDLPVWSNKDHILIENADASDYIFSYPANDGGLSDSYAVHVLNGEIVEIVDQNLEVVYNTNGLNTEYVFFNDICLDSLISHSKSIVESVLKAPSTAEFPGGWLDPYEGWAFGKKKNIIELSSYVDSQNSFGAMIREPFVFKYEKTGDNYTPIYFKFGDQVLKNTQ